MFYVKISAGLKDCHEANNVAAISVLTEEKYFLGKPVFVKKVHESVNVPV